MHVIVDATGLKVFGRGEWATSKHGKGSKGPGWRKFHVAVDEDGRILAAELTDAEVADAAVASALFDSAGGDIDRITADGGYDRLEVYEEAARLGAETVIPPRKDAVTSDNPVLQGRNEHIRHRKKSGKRRWREETGHHQQARAENTFHRYKRTIGRGLLARGERGQRVELMVGCLILNRMAELGMSESTAIRA